MLEVRVKFGDYELDGQQYLLSRLGQCLKLEPIPMELLLFLVERQGQLVTREQIIERLWGNDVFVDTDNSINTAIRKIRMTLKDDPEQPRFVQTIPGKGYRFIAAVTQVGTGPAAEDIKPEPAAKVKQKRRGSVIYMGVGLAVLVLAGVAGSWAWRSWRHPASIAAPAIHSIAVLPLENLTGDPSQEYFADGMTDALITDLAQIGSLRVISRTSIMRYKGTRKPMAEIARELGVEGIVEGTVVRSGSRVRVTSQLIYAPLDQHLWARKYERDLSDIVALQGELAQSIAGEVRAVLSPQERARLAGARQVNPQAYELYLQGQSYFNRQTADGMKQAIRSFQKAVELDPNFALAYAGMAEAYASSSAIGPFPANESFPKAKAAAIRALTLDPLLADAHTALGVEMSNYEFDRPGAQREFLKAIELNPNSAMAHRRYAGYLNSMKRHPEGIAEIKKAVELDPWSPVMRNFLGLAYELAGEYDHAFEEYRRAIAMDPNYGQGRINFAGLLFSMGRYEEGITEYEKAAVLFGASPDEAVQIATALRRAFRAGGAKGFNKEYLALGLRTINEPHHCCFGRIDIAAAYANLGDKDKALAWLEKAYQAREGILLGMINSDPSFKNLQGDPRYSDLMRRLGLPE